MEAEQFRLAMFQCSVFTQGLQMSPPQLLAYLLGNWGSKFDGQPLTIPIPEDAPLDIPSMVLTSSDKSLSLNVSRVRLDIFWNRQTQEGDPDVRMLAEELASILVEIIEHTKAYPCRLASVITRYLPIDNAASILSKHFCKNLWIDGPLKNPENFELHAHKKYVLASSFNVNSWFRGKTGGVLGGTGAIIIEQDINTLAEEVNSRQFSLEQMRTFYGSVIGEFDDILRLYLPNSQKVEP